MPTFETIEEFQPLVDPEHSHYRARYMAFHGGRGSAKSWAVARGLILRMTLGKQRWLCCREYQNSIEESVHKLISNQIELLGLSPYFNVQKTHIYGPNRSEFIFKGLNRNIQSVKSTEDLDGAWLEEAQTASDESWKTLIPTVRKDDSQIIATFNPDMESDPTYQRLIISPPPPEDIWVRQVNWRQNPWFPKVLDKERRHLLATDPDAHEHIWEGKPWTRTDSQVLSGKWVVDTFTPGADWNGPYFGVDWGFSQDPMAATKFWINDRRLFIEYEAGGVGIENDDLATTLRQLPGIDGHIARADNSRPETISHVRRPNAKTGKPGLNVVAAKKWAGSVEDGINWLRSFDQIVIHPRCKRIAEEAKLWRYKTDRLTGDVQPVLLPKHDHYWDSVRYGAEPMIGVDVSGASVFGRQFDAGKHIALTGLWPIKGQDVYIGWDLGVLPACVFAQVLPTGQVRILQELTAGGLGTRAFAEEVAKLLRTKYAGSKIVSVGSRKMISKEPTDERSCAEVIDDVLSPYGVTMEPGYGDDQSGLLESVRFFLQGKTLDGAPAVVVDPHCALLIRGFEGGYHYLATGEGGKLQSEPERNEDARPHRALQFLLQELMHRVR